MRNKRVVSIVLGAWAVGAGAVLVHCVGDDTGTMDGGSDVTVTDTGNDVAQPPDAGFTLSLAPGHVTEDPGDNFPVTINVNRANGFNDPVSFVVTTPPGFTATQPAPAGATSQFYIATSADAGAGDFEVTVTGSSTALVQNVKLGVHVGSLLAIGDGGVVAIPQFATVVDVKAWGAGGGAGNGCANQPDAGGAGGSGGFARATVPVQGGATYYAYVGGGGGFTSGDCNVAGGGGGYSGFFAPDGGPLVMAGGGGGGSSAWFNGGGNGFGANGGAGGGPSGANGVGIGGTNFSQTAGGTQDGGGVATNGGTSGSYLQGGNAYGSIGSGGSLGGGNGGAHAAGGGGGFWGGAGGGEYAFNPSFGGAGGGGSGYNPFDGGANITSDSGAPPNASDPDYANAAGAAGFKIAGSPGRVVIRLPKP